MKQYFHSVRLDKDQCKGCTNCIKRCPTEAIRVRDGKARIIEELCVDCGECIRTCHHHAKIAVEDPKERLKDFDYTIALPAPSFYAQFSGEYTPEEILEALKRFGFDDVYEVALAAEEVTLAIEDYLEKNKGKGPLISQACPAVMGLIAVRFPLLLEQVIPVDTPVNTAGRRAKALAQKKGYAPERIGAFFITPCPGKITAIRQPQGGVRGYVDGAFSMATIHGEMLTQLKKVKGAKGLQKSSSVGIAWGQSGGEGRFMKTGKHLAVDGIHHVIGVLEQLEKGELKEIDYLECQACVGGCVGGALTVKNPFVAKIRIQQLVEEFMPDQAVQLQKPEDLETLLLPEGILPRKISALDEDLEEAIVKMDRLEQTLEDLPGLDCGSCGCPSCRALAEDIVRGMALETDCIFKLRKRVETLAEEVLALAKKVPPAMGQGRDR